MNLIEQYNSAVAEGVIHDDALQREIVAHLQQIVLSLNKPIRPWFRLLHNKNITGMYLYGPVGAGKTYLMDLFFKFVPIRNKLRLHFHHFMQRIGAELRRLLV